jgi:hypothetical protein
LSQTGEPPLIIYLDDCAYAHDLVDMLNRAGFRVVTPKEAGLLGARDDDQLEYAAKSGFVLLTKNPRHFEELHASYSAAPDTAQHAGILVIYQDNDPSRDMKPHDIERAITNLLAAGIAIRGQLHVLNHWRY